MGRNIRAARQELVVVELREQVRLALSEATDRVHLVVPPSSSYLRTVRLVAADAGARAGLDCEEIEDFRIAVDELCHLLMSNTDHHIGVVITVADDLLVAHGDAPRRPQNTPYSLNELSTLIIASTVDYYEIETEGEALTFTAVKHLSSWVADR
jgi:hypothetical protein